MICVVGSGCEFYNALRRRSERRLAMLRDGMRTVAKEAMTNNSARYSCHCGDSPSSQMPLKTPTTGIIRVLNEDTPGGAVVAILNQVPRPSARRS
jgi:hypothetical protein